MRNARAPLFRAPGTMSREERLAAWRTRYRREHPEPSARARGYDGEWERLRAEHLAEEPYCRRCAARGIERLAQTVDHIETIREAPERRLDPSNLQSLCWPCHNSKTQKNSRAKGGHQKIFAAPPGRARSVNF
jgi:5-methylcytosine-specific restriction enzyme A